MATDPGATDPASTSCVAWVLRVLGLIDTLALLAVVMPRSGMAMLHAWAGLGTLPDGPVVGYLARSASALYALHGLLVVFLSFDVLRYWRLIRFFATAALFHGLVMLAVDLGEGMPIWWTMSEGPIFSLTGVAVLVAQSRTSSRRPACCSR
ncbi:MAG: hypothetical protein AB7F89_08295 [Pirellulaceae bacterium]